MTKQNKYDRIIELIDILQKEPFDIGDQTIPPLDEVSATTAKKFIQLIPNNIEYPFIDPDDDGINLVWEDNDIIRIVGIEQYEIFFVDYAGTINSIYYGPYTFNKTIPNKILEILSNK